MRREFFFIISSNGLGHFKRTIGLAHRLLRINHDCLINLICERWQIEVMINWSRCREVIESKHVRIIDDVMHDSFKWNQPDEYYKKERIYKWLQRIERYNFLTPQSLVVSDNLTDILAIHRNLILVGSFLWNTVYDIKKVENPDIIGYLTHQKKLLKKYKPEMLCIAPLKMPEIETLTCPVNVNWMCEDNSIKDNEEENNIAIIWGNTKKDVSFIKNIGQFFSNLGYKIKIPRNLWKILQFPIFDFTSDAFNNCSFIICRPGAGIINECLSYHIPIISFHEKENLEMMHNNHRIEELGFGVGLGADFNEIAIKEKFENFHEDYNSYKKNMIDAKKNGLDISADWIHHRLTHTERT